MSDETESKTAVAQPWTRSQEDILDDLEVKPDHGLDPEEVD